MTDILYVTRPLASPWDEASKIFAYNLAQNIRTEAIHIMTCGMLDGLPETVKQHPVYKTNQVKQFDTAEKIRSLLFQRTVRGKFPITHYFFTPAKLNAWTIRHIISDKKTKKIQTVATLREDLYSENELRKTIFGDYIITYTHSSQRKLKLLGFRNVQTILPGIDFLRYSPTPKDKKLLQKFKLSERDFIVSYPGEYVRLGATDMLVQMLITYFKKYPSSPMKFIFANRIKNVEDTKKKKEILEQLREAHILDRIRFTDTISDMPSLYNTSDVIVFPAGNLYGKFDIPLVIPEAQACEKPVILSDLEQFSEFTSSENSVSVKRGDSNHLASAIEDLRVNTEKRNRIAKNAREFALKTFSIHVIAEHYEKLYSQIKRENMLQ